jgi:hypothetical protein
MRIDKLTIYFNFWVICFGSRFVNFFILLGICVSYSIYGSVLGLAKVIYSLVVFVEPF